MTLLVYVLGAVFTASFLVFVWLCVADAVRAAWRIRRAAHADDAFGDDAIGLLAPHCAVCARPDPDIRDLFETLIKENTP